MPSPPSKVPNDKPSLAFLSRAQRQCCHTPIPNPPPPSVVGGVPPRSQRGPRIPSLKAPGRGGSVPSSSSQQSQPQTKSAEKHEMERESLRITKGYAWGFYGAMSYNTQVRVSQGPFCGGARLFRVPSLREFALQVPPRPVSQAREMGAPTHVACKKVFFFRLLCLFFGSFLGKKNPELEV